MAASFSDISGWFDRGVEEGATHMIVVCDTYDYDDYPSYVSPDQDINQRIAHFEQASMQRVMEVYNLSKDKNEQLNKNRCWEV